MSGFSRGIAKLVSSDATVTITDPTGPTADLQAAAGINDITSTDGSVTITNPTGPTTNLSVSVTGGGITVLTGDGTTPTGGGSQPLTLATVTTAETVGDASHVPAVTTDVKGRVTGMVSTLISIVSTQVSDLTTTLSAYLAKTGGTMSGAIAMGANKITGLANGTAASDAAAFGQIPTVGTGLVNTAGVWTPDATVVAELTATQTLTNKTLTAPVVSSIVNTGTLTLPTSTDTLVGRATTDTLTNKTLTSPALTTPALNGVTVSGTPSAAQVLTATSGTAADWQTPSAGALTNAQSFISATIAYTTAAVNVTSLSLAAGTWLVSALLTILNGSTTESMDIWIGTSSASTTGELVSSSAQLGASSYGSLYLTGIVTVASTTTMYLNFKSAAGSGTIQYLSVANNLANITGMTAVKIV